MADVEVKFGAQIEGLVAGINSAKAQLESITAPIAGISSAFQGLAEVAGAAFAVDKITEFEDRYAELGEQIDRTSKITGISTDQVQQFKLAIQLAGGDADTAAQTLKILEKNIGDAQAGSGKAYEAFHNLGISLDDLKTKSPVEILAQMKTRMDEAGNSAGQAAIKIEYMRAVAGRAGADFLALDGSLDKVKKVAAETGYAMSPEMVGKAKELADSTHTLGAAWTGLSNTIASDIEPAYKRLIDLTTSVVEGTNRLLGGVQKVTQSGESAAMLDDDAQRGHDLGEGQFGPQQFTKPLAPLGPDSSAAKEDDTATQIALDQIKTQEELAKIGLATQKDVLQQEVAAKTITAAQEYATLQDYLQLEYQVESEALDKKLALYSEDSKEYAQTLNQKTLLDAQYEQQLSRLAAQGAQAQVEAAKKTQEAYRPVFESLGTGFDQVIQGVLQGTQTWSQAMARLFDDMALKFIEAVGRMIAEWTLFEATGGAGFLGFGSTNPFAGILAAIPSFETGTSFAQGGLSFLHPGEIVIPPAQSAAIRSGTASIGGSSGGATVNMNVTALDSKSIITALNNPSVLRQLSKNIGSYMASNPSTRGSY